MVLFHITPGYAEVLQATMPTGTPPMTAPMAGPNLVQKTVDAAARAAQVLSG
jgi:hypothetical protein